MVMFRRQGSHRGIPPSRISLPQDEQAGVVNVYLAAWLINGCKLSSQDGAAAEVDVGADQSWIGGSLFSTTDPCSGVAVELGGTFPHVDNPRHNCSYSAGCLTNTGTHAGKRRDGTRLTLVIG